MTNSAPWFAALDRLLRHAMSNDEAETIATALESVRGYLNWYENGGGAGEALAGIREALEPIGKDAE